MTHTYQHIFADGFKLTLTVDFDTLVPTITSDCPKLDPKYNDEFVLWREEVVLPDMEERLSPIQWMILSAIGLDITGHSD